MDWVLKLQILVFASLNKNPYTSPIDIYQLMTKNSILAENSSQLHM